MAENSEGNGGAESTPPVPDATPGRETKGRTTQWEKPGDFDTANEDFDNYHPTDVRDRGDGVRTGTLPSGETIIVRPRSTDGRPTLQIQTKNSNGDVTRNIEIRYGAKAN
jgi:hypothetical protein